MLGRSLASLMAGNSDTAAGRAVPPIRTRAKSKAADGLLQQHWDLLVEFLCAVLMCVCDGCSPVLALAAQGGCAKGRQIGLRK